MTYEIGLGLSRYAEKIRGLTRAVFYNYNPFYEKYPRGTGKMAARSKIETRRARTPVSSFDIPYFHSTWGTEIQFTHQAIINVPTLACSLLLSSAVAELADLPRNMFIT